ncbi:MAG TPA: hypothetical protein VN774_08470, partial [Candidatus Limnocylindrales bacterium]|nr:hypothetical protein [Candidatus Limnocylindrales bacterium]
MPEKSSDSPGPKSPFCFLSYARASGPAYAKRFAQDLTEELTELRKFGAEEDPLFFDQTEIDPGSKWTERLET